MKIEFVFEQIVCCVCKTPILTDVHSMRRLKENGENFFCINGHPQRFLPSEVEKLKKELREANERLSIAEAAKRKRLRKKK